MRQLPFSALLHARTALFLSVVLGGSAPASAQIAYLKASNTEAGDRFGWASAISGDTLVIGANGEDSPANQVNGTQGNSNTKRDSGASYVFVRLGSTWTQEAYLKPFNTDPADNFGESVAIDGDTIVVGAWDEDSDANSVNGNHLNNSATRAGAAYVFVRNGSTWTQEAYLKASNSDANDFFGRSVAISGSTIVVGAAGEDSDANGVNGNQSSNVLGNWDAGAAYVFVRNGATWTQEAYLKASASGQDDQFGNSVSVSGNTIVVGARGEDGGSSGVNGSANPNAAPNSGAAYVFERTGTTWTQSAYVKASNPDNGDRFGESVSVSGDTIAASAPSEDSHAVGVNGDPSDNSLQQSGAVYVFRRAGATWIQEAYVKATNTRAETSFGRALSLSGDVLLASAPAENSASSGLNGNQTNNGATGSGAAYTYVRSGATWSAQDYLKASNTERGDEFGFALSVSGSTAVVTSYLEDSNATGVNGNASNNAAPISGAGYVYELDAPECFLVLGSSRGPAPFTGANHTWTTQIGGISSSFVVLLNNLPSFELPAQRPRLGWMPTQPIARFAAQVLMWNPVVFPTNPEQYSEALDVTVWSNGRVRARPYGSSDGIDIRAEVYFGSDGKRYLRFPFSINGF